MPTWFIYCAEAANLAEYVRQAVDKKLERERAEELYRAMQAAYRQVRDELGEG